ncbi:Transcriptional activator of glycolytic enzymes domain containing protein, partial [Elaphomyces granulatus]
AYEGQRDWTDRLFVGAGIQSSRKTHATRKKAARHAEVGEAEGRTRRVGRWTNDAMSRVYLTSLPRKFMRKMAGFPEQAGSFSLPRAEVEPPPELTRQIWPEVDEWLAKMEAFRPGSRYNQVQQMDLAGSGFLQLLRILRTVVLQDSTVLRPLFPDHPVWKADVFTSDAYQAFAARVTAASEAAEEPEDLLVPSLDAIHRELREVKAAIHDFGSSERSFTIRAADHGDPPSPPPGPPSHLANPEPDAPAARLNPSLEPIRYRFDRTVTTVTDLWEEWTVGRGSGPSVEQLDSAWGPRWRDQTERQFYSRRLPIIKAIQGRHASGIASSLQEAAVQVEGLRTEQHGGISLNKFGKVLK